MDTLIQQFENWLQQHCPDYVARLQVGVEKDFWPGLEKSLGVTLPNDFKAFYQWRNGDAMQHGQYERSGFWFPYNWMSRSSVINGRDLLNELLDNGEFELENWWNPLWVPFFEFNNNYLCMDLDGCWTGQVGQVIEFWHEDRDRRILAPSFQQWFEALVVGLEQGRLVYNAEDQKVVSRDEDNYRAWITAYLPDYPRYVEAGWTIEESVLPPTLTAFTSEQLAQIPHYWETWLNYVQQTNAIDPSVVRNTLERTYQLLGFECPPIEFADSPSQAVEMLMSREDSENLERSLSDYFDDHLLYNYAQNLRQHQKDCVALEIPQDNPALQKLEVLNKQITEQIEEQFNLPFDLLRAFHADGIRLQWTVFADVNISLRNWTYDPQRWELFQALIRECGWIYPMENFCVVCNRPTFINLTHDSPVIEFADGFIVEINANHDNSGDAVD